NYGALSEPEWGASVFAELRQNRLVIAACLALLCGAAAGVLSFRPKAPASTAPQATRDVSSSPQPDSSNQAQSAPAVSTPSESISEATIAGQQSKASSHSGAAPEASD